MLPAPITAMFGRGSDRETVRSLLAQPDVRLVTISGPGGVGKTRLAIEVARSLDAHFADGVRYVPLGGVTDPALVPSAVNQALGIHPGAGQTAIEALVAAFDHLHALVILDNFEQILPAASIVADLLHTAPDLKALVTSRSRLRVSGEHDFHLAPLNVWIKKESKSVADEDEFGPAVELFVNRAKAIAPDLDVSGTNMAAIASICQQLDGLPLAIELAATRSRVLPPVALLQQLNTPLPILTSGPQDLPARQQTLRNAIAWGYDPLPESTKDILQILALFAGGARLHSLAQVTNQPIATLLEGLETLIDHSLVTIVNDFDGQARYGMLQTIREFSREALANRPDESDVRQRFVTSIASLVVDANARITTDQQPRALELLDSEWATVRDLLTWLNQTQPGTSPVLDRAFLTISAHLWRYWEMRGLLSDGRRWLEHALKRETNPSRERAEGLFALGVICDTQGDLLRSREVYVAAREIHASLGNHAEIGRLEDYLGMISVNLGRFDEAAAHYMSAITIAKQTDAPRTVASALYNLGAMELHRGDNDAAARWMSEALPYWESLGDQQALAILLEGLGIVAFRRGDYAAAQTYYSQSLTNSRKLEDANGIASTLSNLGALVTAMGEPTRAEAIYGEAIEVLRTVGDQRLEAASLHDLASTILDGGDPRRALPVARQALAYFHRFDIVPEMADCFDLLAACLAAQGWADRAARLMGKADRMRSDVGAMRSKHYAQSDRQARERILAAMSPDDFARAFTAGALLDTEEAIATAAPPSDLSPPTPALPIVLETPTTSLIENLSMREREVLRLIVDWSSDRQIAERLIRGGPGVSGARTGHALDLCHQRGRRSVPIRWLHRLSTHENLEPVTPLDNAYCDEGDSNRDGVTTIPGELEALLPGPKPLSQYWERGLFGTRISPSQRYSLGFGLRAHLRIHLFHQERVPFNGSQH